METAEEILLLLFLPAVGNDATKNGVAEAERPLLSNLSLLLLLLLFEANDEVATEETIELSELGE